MCKGSEGMFAVLAIYDICRSKLSKFAGLKRGDGDNEHLADGHEVNYVHISGTDPSGSVDAASKLAVMLFNELDEAAGEQKDSLVKIPHALIDFTGCDGRVEKTMMGKSYWIPFKPVVAPLAEKKPVGNSNAEEKRSVSNSNAEEKKPVGNSNTEEKKSVSNSNTEEKKSVSNSNTEKKKPVSNSNAEERKQAPVNEVYLGVCDWTFTA